MITRNKVLFYGLMIAAVLIFGTLLTYIIGKVPGNFNVTINNPLDAFYFTLVTVSTVGYGDIYPVSELARTFVIFLVLAGFAVFIGALTIIGGDYMTERIDRLSGRIVSVEKKLLNNHIVLVGADAINLEIAKSLKEKGRTS